MNALEHTVRILEFVIGVCDDNRVDLFVGQPGISRNIVDNVDLVEACFNNPIPNSVDGFSVNIHSVDHTLRSDPFCQVERKESVGTADVRHRSVGADVQLVHNELKREILVPVRGCWFVLQDRNGDENRKCKRPGDEQAELPHCDPPLARLDALGEGGITLIYQKLRYNTRMKAKSIAISLAVIVVLMLILLASVGQKEQEVSWGLNFSPDKASRLGLDPKSMFIDMVNDLKPKHLLIEPSQDRQLTDEMLIESQKQGTEAILVSDLPKLKVDLISLSPIKYNRHFGYFRNPLPAAYYRLRYTGAWDINLQAQPANLEASLEDQLKQMNPKVLEDNLKFAKRSGIGRHYLTGVEWWYWLAKKQNDWAMWDAAKAEQVH